MLNFHEESSWKGPICKTDKEMVAKYKNKIGYVDGIGSELGFCVYSFDDFVN